MANHLLAPRLRVLPVTTVLGLEVRTAVNFRARLLGLAYLDREQTGPGLLIPRCSSVHTLGMRFALDIYFLDERGAVLAIRREVSPGRVAFCMGACGVLEVLMRQGGEFLSLRT